MITGETYRLQSFLWFGDVDSSQEFGIWKYGSHLYFSQDWAGPGFLGLGPAWY